uniref:Uncharacterized protein n=1 Tax=virus sp. ctd0M1 TaxID=2827993 RepID=A0A8S5RDH0_9VIRU|nr:MAG TPA: hypothetical protein [virus sp. ctd0M1]
MSYRDGTLILCRCSMWYKSVKSHARLKRGI